MATEDPNLANSAGASVAGRYASALFDLATENRQIAEVEAGLNKFQAMLDESKDLQRLVASPAFSADDQAKAMKAVLAKAAIGGLAGNFLQLIAKNRRLFAVPDMVKAYRVLAARSRGEVAAEVISAFPLDAKQLEALNDTLRASVGGKQVKMNTKVDPTLLGGLIVKMGSRMVDSSLRTKLASLKTRLKEVR